MHSNTIIKPVPVLTVEDGKAGSFLNNENGLASMWRVCSNASEFLENGKRLENLSWRLWNHQTLHLARRREAAASSRPVSPIDLESTSPPSTHIPALWKSTDSLDSVELAAAVAAIPKFTDRQALAYRSSEISTTPQKRQKRLLERQVTPVDLDNLVHTIKEKQDLKDPLPSLPRHIECFPSPSSASHDTPRPSSPRPVAKHDSSASTVNTSACMDSFISPASDTSATSVASSHSVVRGFVTNNKSGISSYTSRSQLAPLPTPILKSSNDSKAGQLRKKGGQMFMLGGSSGEDESSLRDRMSPRPPTSLTFTSSPRSKKQTSFKEEVDEIDTKSRPQQQSQQDRAAAAAAAVFDDSDDESEDDDVEDDDEEDDDDFEDDDEDDEDAWEDETEEESKPKQMEFRRIDSTANLTSHRSQLTLALERSQSQGYLPNTISTPALRRRSRTSTPNGPSMPVSPDDEESSPLQMRASGSRTATSAARNIPPPQEVPSRVLPMSPRTTRQKMLAGEMTESFRKQLLWERKQRHIYSSNTNVAAAATRAGPAQQQQAAIRRAMTSGDIPNMAREAGRSDPPINREQLSLGRGNAGVRGVHWNHYFDNESMAGYHQKGW